MRVEDEEAPNEPPGGNSNTNSDSSEFIAMQTFNPPSRSDGNDDAVDTNPFARPPSNSGYSAVAAARTSTNPFDD